MNANQEYNPVNPLDLHARSGSVLDPHGSQRRGSALLIVIGTLALVAVFAAVYIAIGRTDRRAANALTTRKDQKDTKIDVAEYLAGVLKIDRLEAYIQYDNNGVAFGRRELTDAPYTDWTRRSEVDPGQEVYLFTAPGHPFEMGSLTAFTDHRVASDPWLASTLPTYLGNPGMPFSGPNQRPFSSMEPVLPNYPNSKNFLDNRDWLQISNFAPDGRPVNLYNLRPNQATGFGTFGSEVGGFDSEPGFGTSPRADGRPIRRMSNYLSLLDQETPGDPESMIKAFDPAVSGVWIPGANTPQDIGITGADLYNIPAVWTMYQRFMFMPINQPFITLNRQDDVSTWADPDYPAYQYADADGDGFADSRWFEMVAARDKNQGDGNAARDDVQWLYDKGAVRYFIAARAVDLSSMVNVNTATDQLVPPTVEYPMGLTPADVDLRRLLTMQDAATDYLNVNNGLPLSLAQLHRPYVAPDEPVFGPWRPEQASGWEDRNQRRSVYDYWVYKQDWPTANPAPIDRDTRKLDSNSSAMLIGRYAYDALRRGIIDGNSLSDEYKGINFDFSASYPAQNTATRLLQYDYDPADTVVAPQAYTPKERVDLYMNVGRLDPTNVGLSWSRADISAGTAGTGSGLYGLEDLAELLTFHGLNDPENTSRLERVTMGRYQSPTSGSLEDTLQTRRLGPLMSNRPLTLDRDQHGLAMADINQDPNTPPSYDNPDLRKVNGRISFNSMAAETLTPRNKMTTVSGFNPIWPGEKLTSVAEPTELKQISIPPTLSQVLSDATAGFRVYADALSRELDSDNGATLWQSDPDMFRTDRAATLFYGHRGPELALNIAAHAAVNMKDLADGDSKTTVATLMVDNNRRTPLTDLSNFPTDNDDAEPGNQWYRDYPGRADGLLFDPGQDKIAPINTLTPQRQAVNVYGVEPMPVLTEVSSFFVYQDVSESAGGDPDFLDRRPAISNGVITPPLPLPGNQKKITIRGDVDIVVNPDLLMECVAFQLYNPWDKPISLGGDGRSDGDALTRLRDPNDDTIVDESVDQFEFDYYIEWNGYFFKLAEYSRYYPPSSSPFNPRAADDSLIVSSNPALDFPPSTPSDSGNGEVLDPALYPDFIARNVILNPGETRVFYVVADPRFDAANKHWVLDSKWQAAFGAYGSVPQEFTDTALFDADNDGLADGEDGKGWTGLAVEWLAKQLGPVDTTPVMIQPMNPQTGEYETEMPNDYLVGNAADHSLLTQLNGATGRADIGEARLWRKIVTPGEETNDPKFTNGITENLLYNDLLVDRMKVESGLALPLKSGNNEIPKTASFPEDYPNVAAEINARVRNDNSGYSIVKWASTSRRDSPDLNFDRLEFSSNSENAGQVHEWMLSSRAHPADAVVAAKDQYEPADAIDNDDFRDAAGGDLNNARVGYNSPPQTDYEVQITPAGLYGQRRVIATSDLGPYSKYDLDNLALNNGALGTAKKFNRDNGAGRWNHPDTGYKLNWRDPASNVSLNDPLNLRPQMLLNASHVKDAPRLADLLLAWGIGPTYTPDASLGDALASYYSEEWMTLPEALAIALGYENPVASSASADNIWANTFKINEQILDDGRLAIDRFVPFVNADTSEDPPEFTLGSDVIRGDGVPLALGVIDRARAIAPLSRLTDPISPLNDELLTLGLSRPTFGTINVNTAPVEVLRLLPGLTPSRAEYVLGSTGGLVKPEWWGTEFTDAKMPELTTSMLGGGSAAEQIENPDIAAGIVAYRDRMYMTPNVGTRTEPMGLNPYDNGPMNLSPTAPVSVAANMIGEIPIWDRTGTTSIPLGNIRVDRESMTGIEGLRETPGFGSLGELLALRVNPAFAPATMGGTASDSTRWNNLLPMTIQMLGYDLKAQGVADNGGEAVTILSQVFADDKAGTTVDGYDEKIAMANAVFNTLSVRSDFYAVWFMVQGYRQSDVANLRPEDPLVPSIQKRYMMVIDRSNVIRPGDQPKILLLKEVPL